MKFLTAMFAVMFAVSVLALPAYASEVGIQVLERATGNEYGTTENPIEMCTGSLTGAKDVAIKVSNMGPSPDTYKFSLQDLPAGWRGVIQHDIMLGSGESKTLDPFYINNYFTEPGTYFFTIKATSGRDPSYQILPKRVRVEILPCYTISLTAQQQAEEVCAEAEAKADYALTLKNTGKFAETYDISASSSMTGLSKTSITLDPDQSEQFTATLDSSDPARSAPIAVKAKSRISGAEASIPLTLSVVDCYSSEASIQPASATGCIGKQTGFEIAIKNTGKYNDSYVLSVPGWITADATGFALQSGETKKVALTATPTEAGKLQFEVSIVSSDKPSEKKASATLDASECRDIVTIVSPASTTLCKGGIAAYDVTVKNRGILEDTITVSSTAGSLNLNKLTLAPGQSQTLQLNVDTSSMDYGSNRIEVTASDGKISDKSVVDVNVENCYSSKLEITPDNKTVCPFAKFNYTIKLTNTGKLADSYLVKFKDVTENATLASGDSASWDIPVYSEDSGAYSLAATAESSKSASNATAVLVVQPLGKCYAVELKSDETAKASILEATTVKIILKNKGTVADTYRVSIAGPDWAYISPEKEEVQLEPGVEAEVYLYLSPPREADNSTAKVIVAAASNHAAASVAVNALVGNVQPSGGVSGGVSFNNITGAVIFEDSDRPFWKVAAVAIIAIAIIIILVVRFALLVKG